MKLGSLQTIVFELSILWSLFTKQPTQFQCIIDACFQSLPG